MSYQAVWDRETQSQDFGLFKKSVFNLPYKQRVAKLRSMYAIKKGSKRLRAGEVRVSQSVPAVSTAAQNAGFQSAPAYKKRSSRRYSKYKQISFRQERKSTNIYGLGNLGVQNGAGIQGAQYPALNLVGAGTSDSTRVGSKICCTGGKVFLNIYPLASVTQQDAEVDVEVWHWKSPNNSTALSINDLYLNDPNTSTVTSQSMRNIDFMHDFQLLTSKKILLKASGTAAATVNQAVELGWKGKVYSDFNGSSTNMTKGMIVLVIRCSNSKPVTLDLAVANSYLRFNYNITTYYVDN